MPDPKPFVSIHAAQAGCDFRLLLLLCYLLRFQFTQPKRAATIIVQQILEFYDVSIHAAQAGCDTVRQLKHSWIWVSIHAAQAGCDNMSIFDRLDMIRFNSRSPSGLRQAIIHHCTLPKRCFNSRSPSGLRRLLQRYNKKEIHSKDKSRKSILVIILDEEAKAVKLELTDNQPLRNSNKIMFTWDSQPNIFV